MIYTFTLKNKTVNETVSVKAESTGEALEALGRWFDTEKGKVVYDKIYGEGGEGGVNLDYKYEEEA